MNMNTQSPKEWKALTSYEGIRHRTEMYFGSRVPHTQTVISYDAGNTTGIVISEMTWTPAAFTAIREIIDNAIDELIAHEYGDRIDITYDPETMIFSVYDNGRGIPIDWDEEHKDYAASILLSHVHSGRNFDDDTRGETRGVNGVGAKGVNFTSEWFEIEINRDQQRFELRFRESEGKEIIRDEPMIFPTNVKETGTKIRFKLSEKVFTKGIILPEPFVRARVFEIVLCYPKLKVFYNGEKIQAKSVDSALFANSKPIKFTIDAEGFKSHFWLLPSFMPDGSEFTHSLVNLIPVFNGGTHIEAFRRGFYSGVLNALARESKKRKLEPNRNDVADGILLYNITQMSAPNFDSQAKTRLINESVSNIVKKEMDNPDFFKKVIKENPEWIESIFERCEKRTQKKDEGEIARLAKKGKREKVEDLDDAVGTDRSKCILFLAEGKCIKDDTEILVVENNIITQRQIKDVVIGDLVVTHTGSIKSVTNVWKKTTKSKSISTAAGSIVASPEHKFLVHDRSDNHFKWIESNNLVPEQHRLVKSNIVDLSHVEEIVSVEEIDEGKYKVKIVFGNSPKALRYQLTTPNHEYAVLDLIEMKFVKIKASEIDPYRHAMMMKNPL